MKLGIVGLPNVGKSTLFNAITKAGADAANYPFCTIEPNIGVVAVPDERLKVLHDMYNSKKTVYTTIEFYDIAGLVRGASKGEGLGNKFLGHIREVEAVVHVVRCFDDANVVHVDGRLDPLSDIETINLELILADIEMLERRMQKSQKMLKGDKSLQTELDILKRLSKTLGDGKPARTAELSDDEREFTKGLGLLSFKPVIYAANVSESEAGGAAGNAAVERVKAFAESEGSVVVALCAKLEAELADLDEPEKRLFFEELGIRESGLDQLVRSSYRLLDLISFLTAGEPEVRAWTIRRGAKAPQAAGRIHTDFERGFIRAETIAYDKLVECGGNQALAREKGLIRSEGKEYIVKDGDVIHFLFNV
ncbi:MAG: redox-regulated ATPase YchF [Clostridiales Family XIII bacterium]|jgi:GTP-binding protein YchF|nr:redox-regulated ATPase YchF [Clostridiales Family XIII bacterium]